MRAYSHRFAATLFATVILLWLAVMLMVMRDASLPANATGPMLVVFEPGTSNEAAFAAITRAGARPIRQSSFNFIWVVDGAAGALEAQGALGAYRELPFSPTVAGCVAVVDAKMANAFGL
jgi:hypothetical protein